MDTLEFLQTVLPKSGVHYLAVFNEGYNTPLHLAFESLEAMASEIERISRNPNKTVYHACASYQHDSVMVERNGKEAKKFRVRENWDRAQALWVDIDCGADKHAEGKGYLTKGDATKAVFQFSKTLGWPNPMVIDSGGGIHTYWPLSKSISAAAWVKLATALKAALAHAGVIADPSRTADFASILRPVGSVNRKAGGARPVLAKNLVQASDPQALATPLAAYVKAHKIKVSAESKREAPAANDINSDLTGHTQFPQVDSFGNEAADKCAQMSAMRDTSGDVGYEHWRGVIGVLRSCVDGESLAEEWSSLRGDTGHAQTDWRMRYDTWAYGPTKCEFFEKCNPSGCANCKFQGKISSPIMLGRVIPVNEETVETVVTEDNQEVEVEIPAPVRGYSWEDGYLCRWVTNKDGVSMPEPFCHTRFYPTTRIRTEDGTFRIGIRMHMPDHKVRDFEMPYECMASQTDMLRALAKYELMHSNHKNAGVHMAAYLRDQLEDLKRKVEEVNTLTSFGWKDNGSAFLIGDRLYHKDGSVRKVLVGGNAGRFTSSMAAPRGSVSGYASGLNFMYNRPGMEHWQYAVCSGWGSVLTPFCEELFKGLLVALSGGDSGKGKTTACYASLYAFGDAEKMTLKSKEGFTTNALWAFLGAYNNVPVLLDELTNMDGAMFSDVAYGVSRGEEKVRLQSKGGSVGFANTIQWRMSPFVTGNKDFHGLLATTQANSQAEAVRLIQINVDRYPVVRLHADAQVEAEMVHQAIDAMKANSGAAGDAMMRYVVTHQRELTDMIRETMGALTHYLPGTKYRFYRNHGACTIVMAKVAKDLGIIDFDLQRLFEFTVTLLTQLAESVNETNTVSMEDAFSRMMATLASRVVVTSEFRDKRHKSGPETPRNRVIGEIAGRYVLGTPSNREHAGYIMLNQKDVRDWCMQNRTDFNSMLDQLERDGALVKRTDKITLTRGTDIPTVQARCIVVNALKLDRDAVTLVQPNSATDGAQVGAV